MGVKKHSVHISFQTKVSAHKRSERFAFETTGELYYKNEQTYVRFKEKLQGMEDAVQTTVRWDGKELMLIRQGAVMMRQSFIKGKKIKGRYVTKEASWKTAALTKDITIQWPTVKRAGRMEWIYEFYLAGQQTGTYHIEITLEKVEGDTME